MAAASQIPHVSVTLCSDTVFSVSWSQLGGLLMGTAGKWFLLQVNSFNCVLKLWVNGVFEALLLLHATAQRLKNWSET